MDGSCRINSNYLKIWHGSTLNMILKAYFMMLTRNHSKYINNFKAVNISQQHSSSAQVTLSTVLVIIFWNFIISQYRSDSPQVKRNLISSKTNLVYELPHKLPNSLRLRILGNQEIRKFQKNREFGWTHSVVPSLHSRTQTLQMAFEKYAKVDTKLFFFLSSLTGLVHFMPNILFGIVGLDKKKYLQKCHN